MLGSVSLAVNSLTGPAMLEFPALFARSGIIPTCCTIVFVSSLCAFCSLHMANSISKVDGNANFKREVEYSDAFRFFFDTKWFNLTQAVFFGCISCLNISSIVDTAQVVDTFFGHWWPWGGTAAIELTWDSVSLVRWDYNQCSPGELVDGSCTPFAYANGIVFTLGMLVVNAMFMPLALLPLKENAWWQVVGFAVLLVVSVQFVVTFVSSGLKLSGASLWGDNWDDLFGVVLFNYALVIAVPAWLYEREPHVEVPVVVHGSCALSSVLYIAIGILGHLAMPNVSDNMLQSMMGGSLGVRLQLGASIFAFAIVGLGIPLFSVLTRLNLVSSGLCSPFVGNVLSVYSPFAVSWFLYDSKAITKLLSWYVQSIMIGIKTRHFLNPCNAPLHHSQGRNDLYKLDCFHFTDTFDDSREQDMRRNRNCQCLLWLFQEREKGNHLAKDTPCLLRCLGYRSSDWQLHMKLCLSPIPLRSCSAYS